ncbi:hypothetical protein [Desulfurococcus amylolyticus]|nr:hypothetical protein [Desulfurococcus amylolyticus]
MIESINIRELVACIRINACESEGYVEALSRTLIRDEDPGSLSTILNTLCTVKQMVDRDGFNEFFSKVVGKLEVDKLLESIGGLVKSRLQHGINELECSISILDTLSEIGLADKVYRVIDALLSKLIKVGNLGGQYVRLLEYIIDGPFENMPPLESAFFMERLIEMNGDIWLAVKIRTIREASIVKNPGFMAEYRYLYALVNLVDNVLTTLLESKPMEAHKYYSDLNTAYTHIWKNCVVNQPRNTCIKLLEGISGKLATLAELTQGFSK